MKSEGVSLTGEAHPRKVGVVSPEQRAFVARVIAAALEHSKLSNKDAAHCMGYGADQTPISRWTAGVEPPQMARFLSVPELRFGLAVALAEMDQSADVETVLRFHVRRTA